MLLHGDELGRTQQGNNNTYAQDSELSWVHWDEADEPLIEFTAALIELRRQHPTFRRRRFFTGTTVRTGRQGERLNDIVWLHLDGRPMEDDDWDGRRPGHRRCTSTATASPARTPAAAPSSTTTSCSTSTPTATADGAPCRPTEYAESWDVVIDTGGTPDEVEALTAGATIPMRDEQRAGAARVHPADRRARPLGRRLGGRVRGLGHRCTWLTRVLPRP